MDDEKVTSVREIFPLLWAFFDGAWSANGGGKAREEDFKDFTADQMEQANHELAEFAPNKTVTEVYNFCRWLGMQADSGYTVWGQTRQNVPHQPDDEQHKLLAWELLDTRY